MVYDWKMEELMCYVLLVLVLFVLAGCQPESVEHETHPAGLKLGLRQLSKNPEHVESNHSLHRHFMSAGVGSVYGLFFLKDISSEDKIILEDNVQAALDRGENIQWQGVTVAGSIEIGKKYLMNGFMCREFSQTFTFADKVYVVTNKACKIYLNKDGSGFWVLEDTVENYMNAQL